jgi:hypothetical protein
MIEKPDIVKQLREEERIGILYNYKYGLKAKIFEIIDFKKRNNAESLTSLDINSYEDALNLAKKVYKETYKD